MSLLTKKLFSLFENPIKLEEIVLTNSGKVEIYTNRKDGSSILKYNGEEVSYFRRIHCIRITTNGVEIVGEYEDKTNDEEKYLVVRIKGDNIMYSNYLY